jgi:hypothetical protein
LELMRTTIPLPRRLGGFVLFPLCGGVMLRIILLACLSLVLKLGD